MELSELSNFFENLFVINFGARRIETGDLEKLERRRLGGGVELEAAEETWCCNATILLASSHFTKTHPESKP